MRRLVGQLDALAREQRIEVEVFFDGAEHAAVAAAATSRVTVRFAPGGPNAADRAIASRVRSLGDPTAALVVSSDKRLLASVKAAGGRRIGSGEFARRWLASPAQ